MNNVSTVHSSPPRAAPSQPRAAASTVGVDARVDGLLGLYRTHFTNLVRLTMLLVQDVAVAIEIVDDVFVHQARLRGAAAAELPTIGALRNAVVAAARLRPPTAPDVPAGPPALLDGLYVLPHAQRESLVLQHYGALSDEDMAAAAGVSLDVVVASAADGLRSLGTWQQAGEDV
jgi:DNA-directed RNA polymerase specialized sigma24 family protein